MAVFQNSTSSESASVLLSTQGC